MRGKGEFGGAQAVVCRGRFSGLGVEFGGGGCVGVAGLGSVVLKGDLVMRDAPV